MQRHGLARRLASHHPAFATPQKARAPSWPAIVRWHCLHPVDQGVALLAMGRGPELSAAVTLAQVNGAHNTLGLGRSCRCSGNLRRLLQRSWRRQWCSDTGLQLRALYCRLCLTGRREGQLLWGGPALIDAKDEKQQACHCQPHQRLCSPMPFTIKTRAGFASACGDIFFPVPVAVFHSHHRSPSAATAV